MKASEAAELYRRAGKTVPTELQDVKARANKMGAIRKAVDGITFDSSLEAQAYQILRLWERSGAIERLERQPAYTLQAGFVDERTGRKVRAIVYRADFRFFDRERGATRVVDVKGRLLPDFRLKQKLLWVAFPEVNLELWDREKVRSLYR